MLWCSIQAKDKGIVTLFIELMLDISIIALQMSHHSSHIVLCIINTERTQMNNLTKLDQCYSNFMFVTIRTNRLLVFFLKKIIFTTIREKRHNGATKAQPNVLRSFRMLISYFLF